MPQLADTLSRLATGNLTGLWCCVVSGNGTGKPTVLIAEKLGDAGMVYAATGMCQGGSEPNNWLFQLPCILQALIC